MGEASGGDIQTAARRDEGIYRAIFEQAAVGVAQIVSKTGEFVRINRKYAEIVGYTAEELQRLTFRDITHPEDLQADLDNMQRLLAGEIREFSTQKRYCHKGGQIVWVNLTVSPMWAPGEEPTFHIAVVEDITPFRKARQDYETLFQEMLNGFALHEIICNDRGRPVDYRFLAVNPAFERLTGLRAEELLGRTVREVMPNTEDRWIETYGRVALRGETVRFDSFSRELEKHYTVTAFQPTAGQFACIFDDITEYERAVREARKAKDFAESLIQTANAIVVVLDEKGNIQTFNSAAEKITGYRVDEIRAKNWFEVLVPKQRYPEVWQEFERLMAGGIPAEFENPILTKGGEQRHIVWKNNELIHDGRIAGTVSFGIDITERKRMEAALRSSEERYLLAQRLSGVGTWEWNIAENNLFWSDEVLAMFGLECSEFGGTYEEVAKRVHPEDLERWKENVRACIEEGNEHNIEFRAVWPDNTVHWIAAFGDAERDEDGKARRMVGVVMDVTDRKLAEQEREELITRLENQNAELERFTYTVSHDLKSPLITIKGYIGLLSEEFQAMSVKAVQSDLERISGAADKMGVLLEDLLELSRIGRLTNPPEDIPFSDLVREALSLLSGRLDSRQVEIAVPPNLPVVCGDRTRLLEVVQNLIDNAVKYMGDQPRPRIEIGARVDEDEVVCYVRDNGIGIAPRFHEKVFGLFDQLDPTAEGTGIGLALVKRIVEVHGGRIWVESDGKGCGSTFFFALRKVPAVERAESSTSIEGVLRPTQK